MRRSGGGGDERYRDRTYYRVGPRWRDSGRRTYATPYRAPAYYEHRNWSELSYRCRSYYVGSFQRPRYFEHSGFPIGFVIAGVPYYGYRYYDPYCELEFSSLDDYYDHCYREGHPDAMLVLDIRSGYPVATCGYHEGYWLVDDCY